MIVVVDANFSGLCNHQSLVRLPIEGGCSGIPV